MQISFAVTAKLISAFVFATRIVQFLFFLNLKFPASSHLLCLYSSVCVRSDRKPKLLVLLMRRLIFCHWCFQKSAETKSTRSTFSGRSRILKPFSMCEERRLRRGIKKFGYSWKTILEHFTFSRDRTADDLRNRWRSMHRRGTNHRNTCVWIRYHRMLWKSTIKYDWIIVQCTIIIFSNCLPQHLSILAIKLISGLIS